MCTTTFENKLWYSTEESLNDKTIKLKEKELHKLLNKQYNFEEKLKKI